VPPERLWANRGLKTRAEPEVVPALRNLVTAATALREWIRTLLAVLLGRVLGRRGCVGRRRPWM
jgi:hypothetical protein